MNVLKSVLGGQTCQIRVDSGCMHGARILLLFAAQVKYIWAKQVCRPDIELIQSFTIPPLFLVLEDKF